MNCADAWNARLDAQCRMAEMLSRGEYGSYALAEIVEKQKKRLSVDSTQISATQKGSRSATPILTESEGKSKCAN